MTSNRSIPWTEKHRPKKISDIVHQRAVTAMLQQALLTGNMPHLLFHGPPGTGKTSAVHALGRELFGSNFPTRILELNASDDRGIGVIRKRVKNWTKTIVSSGDSGPSTGRKVPTWKIVVLDEADMMTPEAQSALRRIIEDSSKQTRFVIICNHVCKIIGPISSRCARFRFEAIPREAQLSRLQHICVEEKLSAENNALEAILEACEGDLRSGVKLLETAARLCDGKLTVEAVQESSASVPVSVADSILKKAKSTTDTDKIKQTVKETVSLGWAVDDLMKKLCTQIVFDPSLSDIAKAKIAIRLAEAQNILVDGADEELALLAIASSIQTTMHS